MTVTVMAGMMVTGMTVVPWMKSGDSGGKDDSGSGRNNGDSCGRDDSDSGR